MKTPRCRFARSTLALTAGVVFAAPSAIRAQSPPVPVPPERCATAEVSAAQALRLERARELFRARASRRGSGGVLPIGTFTVDVRMHWLRCEETEAYSEADSLEQIEHLNRTFAGTGFSFRLADWDQPQHEDWCGVRLGSAAEARAKAQLHTTPHPRELHIYLAQLDGNLGWASFPWDFARDPEYDGVVMELRSRAGQPAGSGLEGFDEGDTATHEVGHWLGLYHTFQAGCAWYFGGDGVADTPAHQTNRGCPDVPPDTCDTLRTPGKDPTRNFMNYVDDPCMGEFTRGQAERMRELFRMYRDPQGAGRR